MSPITTANILAIGTELLTPYKTDTNSLHLTARLNELGIDVTSKTIVGDDVRDLERALAHALTQADVIITSGGLGPTADDLSREAVSAVLGLPMTEDPAIVVELRARFAKRSAAPMPENNRRQALVPAGAIVLPNPRGSAPGLMIAQGSKLVILLPGPPRELEPMFNDEVMPRLASRTDGRRLRRRVIKIAGQPESKIDAIAAPIYAPWVTSPRPISTTILASPGLVELHLSARGADVAALDVALERAVSELATAIGESVFSIDGRQIEVVVGDGLRARGLTLALAESCTGGMAAARLTEVPGSSAYIAGGVVAYANHVKINSLGVPAELLASVGAVSEPVAAAMAEGVRQCLGADIGVAITGIAGPDGGTAEKPVGTVCFSIAGPGEASTTFTRVVPGDRQLIRQWAVMVALDLVRRAVG